MAKRLPRERERGEGLRSHPLFLLGWQNWYNYCIIENGRDSQRSFYPILLWSLLCLLKFMNHNSTLITMWESKLSPLCWYLLELSRLSEQGL